MIQNKDQFYLLAERSPDAIYFAAFGVFRYANPAGLALLGATSADQLLGTPIVDRIHPDHRDAVKERVQRLYEQKQEAPLLEEIYLRMDGTPVNVEVSAVPFCYNGEEGGLAFVRNITARKRAEAELHQNQRLLHSIIDNTTAVIFVKDLEGRYLLINRRYAELFDAANMLGRTDYDIFSVAVADAVREADRTVLASGLAQEFEEIIPRSDGPHTYISLKFPLLDSAGQPYAVCGISTDITERKRAQEQIRLLNQNLEQRVSERTCELHAAEAQLREILSLNENILMTSAIGIAAYRQDGQCVLANPAFAKTVGGSESQMLAQNFRDIESWRVSGLLEPAETVLDTGVNTRHEAELATSFGRRLWIDCQLSRFISQGAPHLLVMLHDVTEEKRAKQALQERERNFRTLADNVPDNIIRCDCQGRILYINKTLASSLGRKAAEMLGKTAHEAWPDGWFDALGRMMRQVAATGENAEVEQIVPGPDGRHLYHLIRIVAERDQDGKPVSVLAVGRDLTRHKAAEEELRQIIAWRKTIEEQLRAASRAKSEFLATMSHEIRTPMTGILGMAELVLDAPLEAPQREQMETLRSSAEALLTILNDILDLSKLEAGCIEFEIVPFRLTQIFDGVRALLGPRALEKGLSLSTEIDPDLPPWLAGDPARLRQILLNLTGNAIKFTEQGGVTIAARRGPAASGLLGVEFSVTDTGMGVDAAARPRLFQSFSQADTSIARRFGGSGLGLAICKRLVEAQGGDIDVDSEPGKGSRFHFRLSLTAAEPIAIPPAKIPPIPLPPLSILLAEDHPVNRTVAMAILGKRGHAVTVVMNGQQAVEAAKRGGFDLVLMDLQMPEMDGLEATLAIRRLPAPAGTVPIVALTANAMRDDAERCRMAGMDAHVAKPIIPEALFETIAAVLKARSS